MGKIKLTLADRKILSSIEYNPRITLKELAEYCNLSKDTIKYRINRLEEKKIILDYITFIDYKKLGNQSYKLYLKLNCSLTKKEEFKNYLRNQKNVFAIYESNGTWNIAIAIFAKEDFEFQNIENSILELFGDIISHRRFCIMVEAEMYQQNFFDLPEFKSNQFSLWGEIKSSQLDEKDKKLVKLLHKNSRESLVNLSKELVLSWDAVKNRIDRLANKKIMQIYKAIINYSQLGFDHYKILIFPKKYSNKSEVEIIEFLKQSSSCINIIKTIGPWKLEAEFLVKDSNEIDEVMYSLNEKFGENILDLEVSIVRNEELFACKDLLLE